MYFMILNISLLRIPSEKPPVRQGHDWDKGYEYRSVEGKTHQLFFNEEKFFGIPWYKQ